MMSVKHDYCAETAVISKASENYLESHFFSPILGHIFPTIKPRGIGTEQEKGKPGSSWVRKMKMENEIRWHTSGAKSSYGWHGEKRNKSSDRLKKMNLYLK